MIFSSVVCFRVHSVFRFVGVLIAHFAAATDMKPSTDTFTLDYDKLVVAVGSINNTFGTPGVYENCLFLKEASGTRSVLYFMSTLFVEHHFFI